MKKRILSLALTLVMLLAFVPTAALPATAASSYFKYPYKWGFENFNGVEVSEWGTIDNYGVDGWDYDMEVRDGKLILTTNEGEDDFFMGLIIKAGEDNGDGNNGGGIHSFEAVPGAFYYLSMVAEATSGWSGINYCLNSFEIPDDPDSPDPREFIWTPIGGEPTEIGITFQKDIGDIEFHFRASPEIIIHSLTITEIDYVVPEIAGNADVWVMLRHTYGSWAATWADDDTEVPVFDADHVAKATLTSAYVDACEGFEGLASISDEDQVNVSVSFPNVDAGEMAEVHYKINKAEITYGSKAAFDLTAHMETTGSGIAAPSKTLWGDGPGEFAIDLADAVSAAGGGSIKAALAGFEAINVEIEVTGFTQPRAGNRPFIQTAGAAFDITSKNDIELKVDLGSGDYKAKGISEVSLRLGNDTDYWFTTKLEQGKDYTTSGDTVTIKGSSVEFWPKDWTGEAWVRSDEPRYVNQWDTIYAVVVFNGDIQIKDIVAIDVAESPTGWSAESVNALIAEGLVPVALQGNYADKITRAEFFSLSVAVYETYMDKTITESASFPDDEGIEDVRKMAGLGVVTGGSTGVDPHGTFSRAHAAVMFVKLLDVMGIELPKAETTFDDKDTIQDWAIVQVGQAQAAGIITGSGGSYKPRDTFSRQEAMALMWKFWGWLQK